MTLLALDTSCAIRAVAGIVKSDGTILEREIKSPSGQEQSLLAALDEMLTECGIQTAAVDCFTCGIGPGSFTGLRIGLSVVRALAWTSGKRLLGFSSLELLANSMSAADGALVVPLIDARMSKVFAAAFMNDERVLPDSDLHPEDLRDWIAKRPERRVVFLGDGLKKYEKVFHSIDSKDLEFYPEAVISGKTLCEFAIKAQNGSLSAGSFVEGLENVAPEYLRKSEAENQLLSRLKK